MKDEKQYLLDYRLSDYERPSVTADIALFKLRREDTDNYRQDSLTYLSLLLVRRAEHPYKDCWALPGGFLQPDETIEQCALREMQEETSMVPVSLMPVGAFSEVGRDPRGWVITHAFASIIAHTEETQHAGSDADDAQWFDISLNEEGDGRYCLELVHGDIHICARVLECKSQFGITSFKVEESDILAFDHAAIIAQALLCIRNGVKNYECIFDFLPDTFTLAELQNVQETVTNVSVLTANFRRKIAYLVKETEEYVQGAGHRPAKLYKKK